MKLSRNFVKDYIDLDDSLSIKEIAEAMTAVGNEYDSAGPLLDCTKLITGEVIDCYDHPDSDHLHVCKVDIGKEVLEIVCGAPNVRTGLKVIVAQVGAHLPGGEIKAGKIRGIVSNGMICSKAELGLDHKFLESKDKDGIHELPFDTPIGVDPIKVLGLDDEVIDFELTANRGDLLSILGMAYELGAIYHKKVKEMDLSYQEAKEKIEDSFSLQIKTQDCPLFLAKKVVGVTIKESPDFIKNRLIASEIRPINNVVDISNYVMLETGQPLHFYDADRLGDTLIVRNAEKGETLTTLDGIERTLNEEDIVIANQKGSVGLAGVMGGLSTEVEDDTKNILIEAAIFNGVKIRKTSKKIVRSEASNRFEKEIDPKRTYMAMERSCHLLEKYADATILSGRITYDHVNAKDSVIAMTMQKLVKVLGIDIPEKTVISILEDLGFIVEQQKDKLIVTVPTRRLDIHIEEDLIEEVGRMYGMDNIVGKLPVLPVTVGTFNKTRREIKNKLIGLGLNEVFSYTLISKEQVKTFTTDSFTPIEIADPMSEEKTTLRYSLLPSLKDIYDYNKARNIKDIFIFELGKGFFCQDGYQEQEKVAALLSGDYYLGIKKTPVDFYIMKGVVEELLDYLGYQDRYSFKQPEKIPAEFHPYQTAEILLQGKVVGIMGKLHPNLGKEDIYAFELNLDKVLQNHGSRMTYKEIPKYPSIEKDVAFLVQKDKTAEEIMTTIKKAGGRLLQKIEIFDLYTGEKIEPNQKSIAFNLTFSDPKRTLTDEEVMELFHKIIKEVETKHQAEVRDK